jgi:hypothetical protein
VSHVPSGQDAFRTAVVALAGEMKAELDRRVSVVPNEAARAAGAQLRHDWERLRDLIERSGAWVPCDY